MRRPSEVEIKSRPPRAESGLARTFAVIRVELAPRRRTITSNFPASSQTQYTDRSSSTVDHSSTNLQGDTENVKLAAHLRYNWNNTKTKLKQNSQN